MGLNGITMMQLLWTTEKFRGVKNYSDLGEKIYGYKGRVFVNGCILVKQLCACISYLYFVSTQLDFVFCQAFDICYGNKMFIIILVIPVFLMSMANSYNFLSYLSIPSIIIAIIGMLCTFFYSFN
jgi:amino acid permease